MNSLIERKKKKKKKKPASTKILYLCVILSVVFFLGMRVQIEVVTVWWVLHSEEGIAGEEFKE